MPKAPVFPIVVREGSVAVRIYRHERPAERNRDARVFYILAWHVGGQRKLKQFADLPSAQAEARLKAEALASGRSEAAVSLALDDVALLSEIRRLCGNTPPLAAVEEWVQARALTGDNVMAAAKLWKQKNAPTIKPISVADAVEKLVNAKEGAGKAGKRTYGSKLKHFSERFGTQFLNLVTASQLETYLSTIENGVTRNDVRKRIVALFRWAQRVGHLPRGVETEAEHTDRAHEEINRIGIISPAIYGALLAYFHEKHPDYLAALVLAGFCGLRADEIHGKRADRSKRQTWEDLDLARGVGRVTVAKKGTPAYRPFPICPAAVKWLLLCPGEHKGVVCDGGALEMLRRLAHSAKDEEGKAIFDPLPDNAFRHSFCTYRLALIGNPQQVAYEAGNSPTILRRHYAELTDKETAVAWFAIEPKASAPVIEISTTEAIA